MKTADPALAHFAESLTAVVEAADMDSFRDYLAGSSLPALGGDLEPAEIIDQAITQAGNPSAFSKRIAGILATVVAEGERDLESPAAGLTLRRQHLLRNALHLAANLPAEAELFTSLKQLLGALKAMPQGGRSQGPTSLLLPLWRALVYQQTDDSLQEEWFSLLRGAGDWTPARRTLLQTAWKGLLWIPPNPEQRQAGEIVNFPRVEAGLLTLHQAVEAQPGGPDFLGNVLEVLTHTFPRSAEFWEARFGGSALFLLWPRALKEAAYRKWPGLRKRYLTARPGSPAIADRGTVRDFRREERHLTRIFKALSDGTRQEILRLLETTHRSTIGEILGKFDLSQPAISRHLQVLKEADLVIEQKQDQDRIYGLNEETIHHFLPLWLRAQEAKSRRKTVR
ncbi:MAG TPA: metalloregulator ArsR/SmtB family transcription factor [Thermoanaerobaculia bacterium]|nr:metalloregulator ArsR/SmtB family transcription factor [Thermoanaerobaculia bacterium]